MEKFWPNKFLFVGWAACDLILYDLLDGLVAQNDQQNLWQRICGRKVPVQNLPARVCFSIHAARYNLRACEVIAWNVRLDVDQPSFHNWMPVYFCPTYLRWPSPNDDFQTAPQPLQSRGHGINNIYHEGLYSEARLNSSIDVEYPTAVRTLDRLQVTHQIIRPGRPQHQTYAFRNSRRKSNLHTYTKYLRGWWGRISEESAD